MASQGKGSQQKRILEARVERMRAAKQAHLQEMHESSGRDNEQTCGMIVAVMIKLVLLHLGQGIHLNLMTMAHDGARVKTRD